MSKPTYPYDAACGNDVPSHWDDSGTPYGRLVCLHICEVQTDCIRAALREGARGQLRGGIWFDENGKQRRTQRYHPRGAA